MIAIVVFLACCILIGVGAFFYIRKRNTKKKEEEAAAAAAKVQAESESESDSDEDNDSPLIITKVPEPIKVVLPPPPKYQAYPDHDFSGGDIKCEGGVEAPACESRCDSDDKCVSYIHTANDKLCCTKFGTQNYKNLPGRQITGYIKNVDGYDVKEVGDRVAGDIGGPVNVNLPQCKAKCDSLNNCVGFSYQNNTCYAKKAEGLVPTYSNNGFQFYTKK